MILVVISFPVTNSKDAKELHSKLSQKTICKEIRKISHVVKNYKFLYLHLVSPLLPTLAGEVGWNRRQLLELKCLRREIKLFGLSCLVPNGSLAVIL